MIYQNLFLAVKSSARIPRKVILASSCAVYMGSKPPYHEKMELKPATVYGQSKLEAERAAQKDEDEALQVMTFIVRRSHAELIEKVIEHVEKGMDGANKKGRALHEIVRFFEEREAKEAQ